MGGALDIDAMLANYPEKDRGDILRALGPDITGTPSALGPDLAGPSAEDIAAGMEVEQGPSLEQKVFSALMAPVPPPPPTPEEAQYATERMEWERSRAAAERAGVPWKVGPPPVALKPQSPEDAERWRTIKLHEGLLAAGVRPETVMSPDELAVVRPSTGGGPVSNGPKGGSPPDKIPETPAKAAGASVSGAVWGPGAGSARVLQELEKGRIENEKQTETLLEESAGAAKAEAEALHEAATLEKAYRDEQATAIDRQASLDLYAETQQKALATAHREYMENAQNALDENMSALANSKADPWEGVSPFASFLGIMLGGIGAGIGGGPNQALAVLERRLERNLETQRINMAKQAQVIGMQGQALSRRDEFFASDIARQTAQRASAWARVGREMDANEHRFKGDAAHAAFKQARAEIEQRRLKFAGDFMQNAAQESRMNLATQLQGYGAREQLSLQARLAQSGWGEPPPPMTGETLEKLGAMMAAKKQIENMADDFAELDWSAAVTKWIPGTAGQDYEAQRKAVSLFTAFALSGMQLPPAQEESIANLFATPGAFKGTERAKSRALLGVIGSRIDGIVAANRMGGRDTSGFTAAGYGASASAIRERPR